MGTSSHRRRSRISLARLASIRSQALGGKHFTQGVQTGFYRNTKVISSTHLFSTSKITTEGNIAGDGNKQAHRKESSRICTPRDSGLLQSHVSSLQGRKQMATNNRPLSLKYHAMDTEFPHGDTRIHPHSYPAKRLDCVYRPIRRLFAHTSQCTRSEISQICIQRRKSAIHSTAFRACDKPVVVYPDNDRGEDHGIIIHQYLDDWLIRSQSKQVLLNQTEWLLALCKTLGLRINLEKSELTPTRDFIVVGYQYITQINRVYPTQKRIEQIQQKATLFLNSQALPARQWLSLTGLLTATEKLVTMGRTHMRDLQYCLKRQWKQTETNPNQSVQIDHLARTELRWWYDTIKLIVGAPMHPPNPDIQIFTDSSMEGWGAHTLNLEVSGVWSPNERTLHINNLELRAVVLALRHWERVVIGKTILVASDNSTVVAYINKQGGTVSRSLCMEAKEMLIWCHQREIILRARYIPGKLNALADQLSRRGQILHSGLFVPGFSNSYATSSPSPCGTCLQQNTTRNWKSMHLQ